VGTDLCRVILIQYVMSPYLSTVQIQSITFETSASEVLLTAYRLRDETICELLISFSELNLLLNKLQVNNPAVAVGELFEEIPLGGDVSQFVLEATPVLENRLVNLSFLAHDQHKQWIRA